MDNIHGKIGLNIKYIYLYIIIRTLIRRYERHQSTLGTLIRRYERHQSRYKGHQSTLGRYERHQSTLGT